MILLDGLVAALESGGSGELTNIASSNAVTVKDVLRTLLEIEDFEPKELNFDDTKPTMIPKRR